MKRRELDFRVGGQEVLEGMFGRGKHLLACATLAEVFAPFLIGVGLDARWATEGLAPLVRKEIWAVIRRIKAAGVAALIVDKDLRALAEVADRMLILAKGELWLQGTPLPQAQAAASERTAIEWAPPAAMMVTLVTPWTCTGVKRFVVVPSPSWPEPL